VRTASGPIPGTSADRPCGASFCMLVTSVRPSRANSRHEPTQTGVGLGAPRASNASPDKVGDSHSRAALSGDFGKAPDAQPPHDLSCWSIQLIRSSSLGGATP
jgi:hypothetical protein